MAALGPNRLANIMEETGELANLKGVAAKDVNPEEAQSWVNAHEGDPLTTPPELPVDAVYSANAPHIPHLEEDEILNVSAQKKTGPTWGQRISNAISKLTRSGGPPKTPETPSRPPTLTPSQKGA